MIINTNKLIRTCLEQHLFKNKLTHELKFFFSQNENIIKWKTYQNPRMKKIHEKMTNKFNYDDEKAQEKKELKEKELRLLKEYESYSKLKDESISDVPPNLVIKNLFYPPTNSNVVLLGVEKRNSMHASYVHDCMINLKPDLVTTQIAPDMPYFIRTKIQFQDAWSRFVKGKFDYKFYVNPEPTSLYDIMLNNESINQLVSGGILNSQDVFEIGSLFVYTMNHVSKQFEVDTYMTPLIFLYNNPHINCNLIVNDYPFIKYRDNLNKHITISELKSIYNQYKQVIEEQGPNTLFDPLLLKPELFIYPKVSYMTESIRNSCYTSKKVLAIVDRHMTDEIETYWKTLSKGPQNLNIFLKDEFFKSTYEKQQKKENQQNKKNNESDPLMTEEGLENIPSEKRDTFLEYIEKHVLLDLLLEPLVRDYFIKYKVFPFPGKKYSGHKTMIQQIFIMLDHFYFQHNKSTRQSEAQSFDERIMHGAPNDTK